jgi:polyferredoxin
MGALVTKQDWKKVQEWVIAGALILWGSVGLGLILILIFVGLAILGWPWEFAKMAMGLTALAAGLSLLVSAIMWFIAIRYPHWWY